MTLLRQNSDLRRSRIWNWTLPAGPIVLEDGRRINCCPQADACLALCYARQGTYLFPAVRAAHERNLRMILDDLEGWSAAMLAELLQPRHRPSGEPRSDLLQSLDHSDGWAIAWAQAGGSAVRIHDAGDFLSDAYTLAWLAIAEQIPDVLFYAYTKEVSRFRRLVEPAAPQNFRWLYSLGGHEDHLLDLEFDRHAEVFPDAEALAYAGYDDQGESDLLAILRPTTRIGIAANNIPAVRRRMAGASFGQIEQQRSERRLEIAERRRDVPRGTSG